MKCPKCRQFSLDPGSHSRWYCNYVFPNHYQFNDKGEITKEIKGQPCGFACGLAFFFDDDNVDVKTEVGLDIEQLELSPRAQSLIDSGALNLNEIDRAEAVSALENIQKIEKDEEEWEELKAMMTSVVGRSAGVHRTLASGDTYRKYLSGGLISKKMG